MTITKLALMFGLTILTACVDEIEEDPTQDPQSAPVDEDDDADTVVDPDLSDLSVPRTCGNNEKQADGTCLPK